MGIYDKRFHQDRFFDSRGSVNTPALYDIESPEGDSSAYEIVRHIFKRAGLGGPAYEPLYVPFAEALVNAYSGEGDQEQEKEESSLTKMLNR